MTTVPGWARLLLAIGLFVGISVSVVAIFHDRLIALAAGAPWPPEEHEVAEAAEHSGAARSADADAHLHPGRYQHDHDPREAPGPKDLAGRIMALTATAFVFLLAFTMSQFWGSSQDARSATQDEGAAYQSALVAAQKLPAESRDEVVAALNAYADTVVNDEWPQLQQADTMAAYASHRQAGAALAQVALLPEDDPRADEGTRPQLAQAVENMLTNGTSRIDQLPRPEVPAVIGLVFILAVINLAVTAAFQPATRNQNLFLIAMMGAILAVMLFVLVEASNPYLGAGAVRPEGFSLLP